MIESIQEGRWPFVQSACARMAPLAKGLQARLCLKEEDAERNSGLGPMVEQLTHHPALAARQRAVAWIPRRFQWPRPACFRARARAQLIGVALLVRANGCGPASTLPDRIELTSARSRARAIIHRERQGRPAGVELACPGDLGLADTDSQHFKSRNPAEDPGTARRCHTHIPANAGATVQLIEATPANHHAHEMLLWRARKSARRGLLSVVSRWTWSPEAFEQWSSVQRS